MRKLAIIGASGHGKVVADIARRNGYKEIVFLDDNDSIHECGGYPVIGKSTEAGTIDADVIIGIGNAGVRKQIQELLQSSLPLAMQIVICKCQANFYIVR